jgi:outer membrane protein
MKSYYNLVFFLFLIILPLKAFSNVKTITFIDVDQIVYKSNIGSKEIASINSRFEKQYEIFKNKELDLIGQKEEILSKKNILSKAELDKMINIYNEEFEKFKKEKKDFDNSINEERIMKINKLLQQLNSILSSYAVENSIDLIIKKKDIIIGKSSLDITEDIMKIFNNNVKQLN